ncbi:MAG: alpha/beta hydrolase [Bacteroidota bacterium]
MPSIQHQLLLLSARNIGKAVNRDLSQVQSLRRLLDVSTVPLGLPRDVQTKTEQVGKLPVEWYFPKGADTSKVILYVHGGGFAVGSVQTHRALTARMADVAGCVAISVEYRLAPEHVFPSGLEDVVQAYEWLILKGYNPSDIVMAGDSAGGGLVMATLLTLRKLGSPMPAGAILMSPWVDLTFSGESAEAHKATDPIVVVDEIRDWAVVYAGKYSLLHPMVSPVFADLSNLPPIYIQASTAEVLTDDAVRLHKKIEADGGMSEIKLYEGLIHVWQLLWRYVPEAQEAIEKQAEFLNGAIEMARRAVSQPSEIRKAS